MLISALELECRFHSLLGEKSSGYEIFIYFFIGWARFYCLVIKHWQISYGSIIFWNFYCLFSMSIEQDSVSNNIFVII